MLNHALSAALLLAAVPGLAQPAGSSMPMPPNAIMQAAQAFGLCIKSGVQGVAPTTTAQAGAASVLGGCTAQRGKLERAAETYIATSNMPEAQKAAAREQLRSQLAGAQEQVAEAIRKSRAARAAPAKPK